MYPGLFLVFLSQTLIAASAFSRQKLSEKAQKRGKFVQKDDVWPLMLLT